MASLDLAPAITALRSRPEEFELVNGRLHHLGSRHSFRFRSDDDVQIEADCDCAFLRASREQSRELKVAYQQWQASYWQPLQINRDFASHFEPPGLLRRLAIHLLRHLIAWRSEPKSAPLRPAFPLR